MTEVPGLNDDELTALRKMLETEARMAWLWATLRVWAVWIAAVLAAIYAIYRGLGDLIRHFVGGGA